MNVAAVVRRLETGGFTHDQAAILAEELHDEVTAQIATKEHVDLVVGHASERLEVARGFGAARVNPRWLAT